MRMTDIRQWRFFGIGLGLAATLAVTAHLSAQPPSGRRGGFRPAGPPPGAFVGLRELDLTEAQRRSVRDIMEQTREEGAALVEQLRTARAALEDAVMTDAVNESMIRALAAELGTLEADAAVQRARVNAGILGVLTPDQRERLAEIRDERRARLAERSEERRERRREERRR